MRRRRNKANWWLNTLVCSMLTTLIERQRDVCCWLLIVYQKATTISLYIVYTVHHHHKCNKNGCACLYKYRLANCRNVTCTDGAFSQYTYIHSITNTKHAHELRERCFDIEFLYIYFSLYILVV